jgi:hypothetical protein
MPIMRRIVAVAIAVWALAGVAAYNLLSGWLITEGGAALVMFIVLFLLAWTLFAVAAVAAIRARRKLGAAAGDRSALVATGARGMAWTSVFALGFSVLFFANCGSSVQTQHGNSSTWVGPMSDAHTYWSLAPWLLGPLLIALALPAIAAVVAGATRQRRWATVTMVATIVAAVVAFVSVPVGFFLGVSACDVGTIGGCAAGIGSLGNLFSVASLVLFLPYVLMITSGTAGAKEQQGSGL